MECTETRERVEEKSIRSQIAEQLADEAVRLVLREDETYVCLVNPDEETGQEKEFSLDLKLLGYWSISEVVKVDGDGSLRFLLAVNDPTRVGTELKKILRRVAEKAMSTVRTQKGCEAIADRIADSVVRKVDIQMQGGQAVGLFAEQETRQALQEQGQVEVVADAEMLGCGWFYKCQQAASLKFILEVNDPDVALRGLREVIAQAVKAGIEQYRTGGRNG